MNYLIWRLHRNQAVFAAGALAVLAVVLLITGLTMAHDYRTFLATCAATQSCSYGQGQLFRGDGAIIDLVNLTLVVPLLFGLFWGAPLLAKEFEDGTHNLVWTQSVTRRRWLRTKILWALLAAAVWGGAMAVLVSWWRFPENALYGRFGAFDVQGTVPVAYSLFAVALGIAVGSVLRRVMASIATTLGIFVALRVVIGVYVRPYYLAPISKVYSLAGSRGGPPTNSWIISNSLTTPNGHILGRSLLPGEIPGACHNGLSFDKGGVLPCLVHNGYRQLFTFQPASRFWAFQGIESALFLVLAVALLGFAYWRVLSRDA